MFTAPSENSSLNLPITWKVQQNISHSRGKSSYWTLENEPITIHFPNQQSKRAHWVIIAAETTNSFIFSFKKQIKPQTRDEIAINKTFCCTFAHGGHSSLKSANITIMTPQFPFWAGIRSMFSEQHVARTKRWIAVCDPQCTQRVRYRRAGCAYRSTAALQRERRLQWHQSSA